jgi:hypothetical protein
LAAISISPSTRVRSARMVTGDNDTISVGTFRGTDEDPSLPCRPRHMSHLLARLASSAAWQPSSVVSGP